MSPSSRRKQNKSPSLGQAVFYPSSLPPPPRRSSKNVPNYKAGSVSPPSPTRSPSPRYSNALGVSTPPRRLPPALATAPHAILPPYEDALEFPFPSQPTSPAGRLTHLFDGLNFATPQSGVDTYNRLLYTAGSEPDINITTPNAIPLSELINESLLEEEQEEVGLPESATLPKSFHEAQAQAVSSSVFQSPHSFSFDQNASDSHMNDGDRFALGSPAGRNFSPQNRPPNDRQVSWSALGPRRASLPHVTLRVNQSPNQNSLYIPPSPLTSGIPSPIQTSPLTSIGSPASSTSEFHFTTEPEYTDVFSPDYSLDTGSTIVPHFLQQAQAQLFTPPHTTSPLPGPHNTLQLHYTDLYPEISPSPLQPQRQVPTPPPELPKSEVAAYHLRNRTLNPSFARRYEIRDELGSGGFGFVCSAIQTGYKNQAGLEVAVKFIFKDRIQECDYAMLEGEPVESYVLSRCRHPNIIRFEGLYEDREFYYLVQELHGDPWAPGHTLETGELHHPGFNPLSVPQIPIPLPTQIPTLPILNPPRTPGSASLFSPIHSNIDWSKLSPSPSPGGADGGKRPNMARRASYDLFECVEHLRFSEEQARKIFRQIVEAVSYLHKKGIYHRDLKDENIVIDRNLTVKVIDFGSAVIENRAYPPLLYDHFRGTMSYASAEVLNGRHYQAAPADIWSLGIILGIILTGESPFPNTSWAQVGRIKVKKQVPMGALDLMQRCVCTDPRKRATIEQVERHPWLRGMLTHRGSFS
ncbi:hypothetical protein CI109_100305 [Kwoniella shandongensis]|uniref:Protein kinase domain-containing protein n=1 Tax=Kwoniella shandongensis TaxID=1734106 RepID=A0A5M6C568_9TREE|nr:uncharacterized protein CI109_001850 [Kwoniella shandongensis]KAA5529910.1 hypothetical protein CI109_001850 [Kwoniella shandongensis]